LNTNVKFSISVFLKKSPFVIGMRETMRLKHMSLRTEESYCRAVAGFCAWTKWKPPAELNGQDVTDYLTHLAVDKKVSASTQNQAFNAILFMFRHVLKKEMGSVDAKRAKTSQHIPEWLTREELRALFKRLDDEWNLLAKLGYGTGMRLMELLRLRIKDCDFGNACILIRDGKGGKDRIVPMPKSLVDSLQGQITKALNLHAGDLAAGFGEVWLPDALAEKFNPKDEKWQYVFPSREICTDPRDGKKRRHHLFETGFQTALRKAGIKAGIKKRVHPHALRHSFATHYLENSGNLILLKDLLGHQSVETTQIYTHCISARNAISPADVL
jgi:integron integrase